MSITQRRLLIFVGLLITIPTLAYITIKFAQGYRPDIYSHTLKPSGLLVATSIPDGAEIFVDGKLKSATNNTIALSPDTYNITIKKDGFSPWSKDIVINKELVTKIEALLFPTYPDLKALTFTGAQNPVLSPDGLKVSFNVATGSAEKQGVWVLDLLDRPFGLNREPRQVLQSSSSSEDFNKASYEWSPDSKQLLITFWTTIPATAKKKTPTKTISRAYLIDASKLNLISQLTDIAPQLSLTKKRWVEEAKLKQESMLAKIPTKLAEILSKNTESIVFAPDETKILYTATASATIPDKLIQTLPVTSTQKEDREVDPGKTYVYDLKEDKNFFVGDPSEHPSWFPTSNHIFLVQKDRILVSDYDGTNRTEVYSGPFVNSFAFPFPGANRVLILTSIGKDTPPNLYAITLR